MRNKKNETDVLVIGSGPSGFSAAYTAAKSGVKTMIIEQLGDIGGISTSGLMSHWAGDSDMPIYREILRRSAQLNEGEWHNKITCRIDPEKLKTLYLTMLDEVGCRVRLYTFAFDVIMEGSKVVGVRVISKNGLEEFFAKVIIDASGDGDIAAKAGVPYELGRKNDQKMQPATIMFKVAGVNKEKAVFPGSFESTVDTPNGELQSLGRSNLPYPAGHVLLYDTTLPGIVTCNMTNSLNIDGTNADKLTRATIVCRKQMDEIVKFLRKYAPGYENCYIISSASLVGIRETRHFEGVEQINEDDILAARVFENWVVKGARFNFDVHNISGSGLDETGAQEKFSQKNGYTIPYGCLLPKKIDGLLLCGRNISGTHMAHSNFRAMPICAGIGQAAGTAASKAVIQNKKLRELDVKEIQKAIVVFYTVHLLYNQDT